VNDALGLARPFTLADTTPTSPESSVTATRYLGVLYASNLTPTPQRPFVLATLEEAHALLAVAVTGGPVTFREWHAGAVVEQESRFPPNDEAELVLWRMTSDAVDLEDTYPDLLVKVGPKGGIFHERT